MNSMKKILLAVSIIAFASGFAFTAKAYAMGDGEWPTLITFNEPILVGNLSLTPGTYEFYLTSGPSTRNVIMIYSVDDRRWIGMAMGINDNRLDSTKNSGFTLRESTNGSHKTLEYWFYPGWTRGIKMIYPESQAGTMTAAVAASAR